MDLSRLQNSLSIEYLLKNIAFTNDVNEETKVKYRTLLLKYVLSLYEYNNNNFLTNMTNNLHIFNKGNFDENVSQKIFKNESGNVGF